MKFLKLYIVLYLMLAGMTLAAQTKVHVYTRTVTNSFKYNKGDIIKINAFQADVRITGWSMDSVSIILRLIAKSADYSAAKKDITNWAYAMNKDKAEIVLKNYLKKDLSQNSFTQLTAEYNIRVPAYSLIHLSNFSGTTNIQKLDGVLLTNIKYGSIILSNMKGIVESNLEVSDFNCRNSDLLLTISSKHTAIYLDKVQGSVAITAEYGSVKINEQVPFRKLTMDISRADAYMVKKSVAEYDLDLYSMYGKINIDIPNYVKEVNRLKVEESPDYSRCLYKAGVSVPLINITNKYGNIVLN